MASSYFGKTDPMQWTSSMDEYLETLSGNRELVYDELFCHQVRLQRIAAEVENMSGTDVPSTFYVAALRRKMNEIKAGVSPSLLQNRE
ncbi:hypothetical protein N7468_006771 [Penicillium chermesinum]|uniref:Uncharacterized protein n=1 Tax=Penicillium chermesinum TaxID=63820 RepID=A0A9W9TJX3_9EURO|nr:uncharacterized protein N7468_006771 [Penicillium chermesinum]KAJ5225546.1 hypothetical protein N7468_006771 [Penicillium chermesinum]